jgi:hypothetical protein
MEQQVHECCVVEITPNSEDFVHHYTMVGVLHSHKKLRSTTFVEKSHDVYFRNTHYYAVGKSMQIANVDGTVS